MKLVSLKNILNYYLINIKLDINYYNYNIIYIKFQNCLQIQYFINKLNIIIKFINYYK